MGISNTTYKQTELGLIPQDWEVKTIDEICYVTKLAGYEYSKHFNSYKDGGEILVIRGTNITNNKLDLSDCKFIPKKISDYLIRSKLFKNDLVFAYVGTIGPVYLIEENDKFHLGPNTAKIRVEDKNISPTYLNNYFLSNIFKKEIELKISVGAQPSLSMQKIRTFKVPIPSTLAEQTAIANALSDVDNLIESLEKIIEKKKLIKQGALQKLLKPKKGWGNKRLGELLQYEQPTKYIVNSTEYFENGLTPVLTVGKSFILGYTEEVEGIYYNSPVIIFDDFTTASRYVNFSFKIKSSAIKLLKPTKDEVNLKFVYESLQFLKTDITDHKRHWISEFQNFEIYIPTKEEQEEIADILTDMDNEIELLQSKLLKYQQVKQGMMQNLLTGKIRLVNTESKQTKIAKPKSESTEKKQGHNKQINEAVIISVLVHRYANEKFALSRFRYTKYLYLLHRHIERKAEGFLKKAAGPYNPSNRYGGPEKIALGNKYIKTQNNGFVADTNIAQAIQYFNEWYDIEHLNWLDAFKFSKNEHLEVLTTVDMAIDELIKENKEPNLSNVKSIIATNKEWKPKLEKPFFSDIEIQKAITESLNLFY